ncbi:MAG: hypothetical protein A3H32_14730 [Betaproteobacteria bacterium RIFCSPLOWO2_02_FULL_63_19]|nr:MAG: hypothetical protein A3H32_14730 [Betaproteobacteria bacterium RIFCSPLOWO2_02_FULL_63_19]
MATFRRVHAPGGTFFFTVVTHRRAPVLADPGLLQALREAMTRVRRELPFQMIAMVVLPDHMHCVWKLPDGDGDYPRRWSMIKRLTSQRVMRAAAEDAVPSTGSCAWRTLPSAPDDALPSAPDDARPSGLRRRESGLWQRRYWEHQIRNDADLDNHISYIHWNPVKHGYVSRPREWPYSTVHRFQRQGIIPRDWGVDGEFTGDFGE